ncbi:MAG: T9SS type A sorting domain-containing protein, partial [Bacteroidetes bacterium]
DDIEAFREAVHHANRMGAIICASRGNIFGATDGPTAPHVPGTIQDEWVMCVGGTNNAGNYYDQCKYGGVIDVAALATAQLNQSCRATSNTAYGVIPFTSGATPHVAGLAALMLSLYNPSDPNSTQLVQEDIEFIIQASATDVGATGPDEFTGHGRINAGAAIAMIQGPSCNVFHFGTDVNSNNKSSQLIAQGIPVELTEPYTTESGQTFDKGTFTADVYKVTAVVSHPLPSNFMVDRYWERHSSSTVFNLYQTVGGTNFLQPVENVKIIGTPSNSSATLEGYVYFLKNSDCSIQGWIPAAPEDAELTYSVLGCQATSAHEIINPILVVYPNPVSDNLLEIAAPKEIGGLISHISIYDFSGKEALTIKDASLLTPDRKIRVDVTTLSQGIYTVVLYSGNGNFAGKFVKI